MIDKIKYENKQGYDIHKYLIALLNQAKNDCSVFPETISKNIYDDVRQNKDNYENWFVGLVGFCASYNGKWFGGYANNVKTKIGTIRNYTDESIRNLVRQAPNLKNTYFECKDFRHLNNIKNCVIYCDIPYKDTTDYKTGDFPYDEFYKWCKEMSKSNVVLISEYNMPEDFECIWEKEIKCTLDNVSRSNKVEKLFIHSSRI